MKALKVFCIIFTVVAMITTGIFFAVRNVLKNEVKKISDTHQSEIATVTMVGDEYTYQIKDSNIKPMNETEYIATMTKAGDIFTYGTVGGGVVSVLLIAGAVASGKAAKKRNAVFAAA